MINLYSKIQDAFINEIFYEIDSNIIVESLNCKVLKELAKQLKQLYDDEKDERNNQKYGSSYNKNKKFKNIFFSEYYSEYSIGRIQWDKITDDDIKEIDLTSASNKEQRKAEQEAHKILQSKSKSILLIYDPNKKIYEYAFFNWGQIIQLTQDNYISAGERKGYKRPNGKFGDLKVSEKMDLLKGKILYFIDLTDKLEKYNELKRKRDEDKKGVIYFDEESLQRMAKDNFNRYKEIVAKNKANRLNNTALLNEAGELIEGISKLATYVAKKPIDNADLIEPVNKLCLYIYDIRKYHSPRTRRDNGYYSGINGLLPMIAKYTQLLHNVQKTGGFDYQRKELESVQKEMKNTIIIIKDLLTRYDIDLKKIKSE